MLSRINLWCARSKIWNYIKYRSFSRKPLISIKHYTPQIGAVILTKRCNLDCDYCVAAKVMDSGKSNWRENEASLKKIQLIFKNPLFSNCLLVDLQGGEPLLVDDLDRIVDFLSKNGHITNTSTNGVLLAERIADLRRAGISRINVSLYEANRSIIENNIEKINRILPVHMSMVLLRSDVENRLENILDTVRFAYNTGCRSLRFWIYRPIGVNPNPNEIINDTNPAYIALRKRVEESLPGFCLWPSEIQTGKVVKRCPQLWQRIICDIAGNIQICCGTDMMLKGENSNLFDTTPVNLINHPTLVDIRKQLIDPVCAPPDICKTCNLLGESGW
jgi:pyruvate-formate lyase-activating enzyme